jgi:hypothetical protein
VKLMRKRQKCPWLYGPHLSDASPTFGTRWEIDCARLHRCRSTTDHARSPCLHLIARCWSRATPCRRWSKVARASCGAGVSRPPSLTSRPPDAFLPASGRYPPLCSLPRYGAPPGPHQGASPGPC